MLHPTRPPNGSTERRLLGELTSLIDHPAAHSILAEAGFEQDLAREAAARSDFFLRTDLPKARWESQAVRCVLLMGTANMMVTFKDARLLPLIENAVLQRAPEVLATAEIFALKVSALRDAAPDAVVNEAVDMARAFGLDATGLILKRSVALLEM